MSPLPFELSLIFINCEVFYEILYYCLVNGIKNTLTVCRNGHFVRTLNFDAVVRNNSLYSKLFKATLKTFNLCTNNVSFSSLN